MISTKKTSLVIASIFAISGCTTLSRKDCVDMDWKSEGYESAMKGQTAEDTVRRFHKACQIQQDVPVDRELLKQGYLEGIKNFCTPKNIRRFAAKGGVYKEICPQELETSVFKSSYESGRTDHQSVVLSRLESKVNELEEKVTSLQNENEELKRKNSDLEDDLKRSQ